MLEFKMSYLEPGYHKPGDPPFLFPPPGVNSVIDANIIEIEGKNGTGKTTLLNTLALSLGYLNQEKELERKPILKQKLEDLDKNPTLEYRFRISCEAPEMIDLLLERTKGQKPRYYFNSTPIGIEPLEEKFEVVYIAEDDPKKVIDTTLGKLSDNFNELEKMLNKFQSEIQKYIMEINEYKNFKNKEDILSKEISDYDRKIEIIKKQLIDLEEIVKKIEEKDNIMKKIELITNEEKINKIYEECKKKYEDLIKNTQKDITEKIRKEREKLKSNNEYLKTLENRIRVTCDSLANYGIQINCEKLLEGDFSELNEWNRKIEITKRDDKIKIEMVRDLIDVLRKYPKEEKVPLLNITVNKALESLYEIRIQLDSDRVFNLFRDLTNLVREMKEVKEACEFINQKIHKLTQKNEELKELDRIQAEYYEAQKKYLELQNAKKEDLNELILKLRGLSGINDKLEDITNKIKKLENDKNLAELKKTALQEELNIHREKGIKKPKFEEEYSKLKALYEAISPLREKIIQWIQILKGPSEARRQYTSLESQYAPLEKRPTFGLEDYERFIKAVGEYLGNKFEPVAYDYKFHEIKFFDIENDVFITKDDRHIPINKLSQGQSKITTLTGILKKMNTNRKKIVLIDEIADLDPENLNKIRNQLLEEYKKGSIILAVLVRPPHENISKPVEIRGWK